MNALVFLGVAAALSVVGCAVLWLRSRQPSSMDAHIRDFARELDALAPGSPPSRTPRPPSDRPPERPGEGRRPPG